MARPGLDAAAVMDLLDPGMTHRENCHRYTVVYEGDPSRKPVIGRIVTITGGDCYIELLAAQARIHALEEILRRAAGSAEGVSMLCATPRLRERS